MGSLVKQGVISSTWRPMFVVGALPALLALVIRYRLREPEQWQQASLDNAASKQLGSYSALFSNPTLRKNAFIGLTLAFAGVVGLWGIVFFSMDLLGNIVDRTMTAEGADPTEIKAAVAKWKGTASFWLNIGAAAGMFGFGLLTQRIGRRPAFAISFIAAGATTIGVFQSLQRPEQVYYMFPIMGFCMLSLFAGYAIYFPELFPTYLRSTGTSFCYNVGRFVAAAGPALLGLLTGKVFADHPEPLRMAGLSMCSIFLLGLLVLPFAPETKDRPLPE
ncbi:MAG: MFS transporter, partial [Planctomycetaceae bacterium]|nr:MFS transporter [Planctomycetaceae bacterium]